LNLNRHTMINQPATHQLKLKGSAILFRDFRRKRWSDPLVTSM
jgi:hypothetical protein